MMIGLLMIPSREGDGIPRWKSLFRVKDATLTTFLTIMRNQIIFLPVGRD
jgi:hypothetical protein